MNPHIRVTGTDATASLKAALAALARRQVLVGVPEEKNSRKEAGVSNAALVYLHTHGSPLHHIPARPIIEPAIEAPDNKATITNKLGEAARAVLNHNPQAAKESLKAAGILGRNAAIRWFTDPRNHWASNSMATIRRKGSDRPLIDTAQMRRSITYVMEDK